MKRWKLLCFVWLLAILISSFVEFLSLLFIISIGLSPFYLLLYKSYLCILEIRTLLEVYSQSISTYANLIYSNWSVFTIFDYFLSWLKNCCQLHGYEAVLPHFLLNTILFYLSQLDRELIWKSFFIMLIRSQG